MIGVFKGKGHLRHGQGLALLGAAEDHILHPAAPKIFGRLLPQYPAYGIGKVALAAAVGADDGRDPVAEGQFGFLCKGFEPLQFQFGDSHECFSASKAARAAS